MRVTARLPVWVSRWRREFGFVHQILGEPAGMGESLEKMSHTLMWDFCCEKYMYLKQKNLPETCVSITSSDRK
jgi:hypothetical protein